MTEPQVDPEAGAELLFKELEIDDTNIRDSFYRYYIRIKVFNERGAEEINPIELEAPRDVRIRDIAGRVVKPDGTIIQLDKDEIFTRESFRYQDERWKKRSFSLPGVEPGCIVEYQWEEVREGLAQGVIFKFSSSGANAAYERSLYQRFTRSAYERVLTEWLRRDTREVELDDWSVEDDRAENTFAVEVAFDAPMYAQRLGGRMLIFRPFMTSRPANGPSAEAGDVRTEPIVLNYRNYEETIRVTLPEGFAVDELPESVVVKEDFGELDVHYRTEDGAIVAERKLLLREVTLPPEDLNRVRAFFQTRERAEKGRAVIIRVR
ncbi:MAG: transglutaminase domain-containing protein [Puniceicoccaceae bacterium 5H]|nr:MAG: transglutaminase domain-containing protein [Puniceicoccaceae bacterium 5H]